MKFILCILIIALVFSSCAQGLENSSTDKQSDNEKRDTSKAIQNYTLGGCYMMIIGKDTALMNITQKQDSITGSLMYKRNGKDNNIGTIHLLKINNRAEGWYIYQSKDKTFVRQIVFKITGNSLAEAYGDIKMNNDTAIFKYPHALNYEEKHPFNKVNCN